MSIYVKKYKYIYLHMYYIDKHKNIYTDKIYIGISITHI